MASVNNTGCKASRLLKVFSLRIIKDGGAQEDPFELGERRWWLMIFEVASSLLFGSIAVYAHAQKDGGMSDAQKLQKIFANCGLNKKEDGRVVTNRLLRKRRHSWGTEYIYRIPLGNSLEDYEKKIGAIQDGLNNKRRQLEVNLKAFPHMKQMLTKKKIHQKQVELSYDGTLHVKVYNHSIPSSFNYSEISENLHGWTVPIGMDRENMTFHNFDKIYHMLVGGATGGGKSSFLDMMISHLMQQHPEDVRFTLIDLKGGIEFDRFRDCRQVVNYADEPEDALTVLQNVVEEMKKTLGRLKEMKARDVIAANIKERHFIVIDEIGELASHKEVSKELRAIKEECEYLLSNIARLGRSQGIRVVTATQHPTVDVVPVQLKRNSDARLCFRVDTTSASMVILDAPGADQLPEITGRAIYKRGSVRTVLQTPWMTEKEMDEVILQNYIEKTEEAAADEPPSRNDFALFEETSLSH
ncbi:FtsK/SpoIIIE domain-containing protein [Fictibacillus aquaticus]|uniref:FtsK domain-containing protein n=1 Tax=Fictibacillus aquaticus TaxID=2021314 RepID=A0A235F976_9BACL|nr:FtsK/SpoIIIE domain-containing protein [Fictibacillus aquaticus]OYD57856.1 hypothetical protein CGZ90_08110 [Fictibacillus aquaticus]